MNQLLNPLLCLLFLLAALTSWAAEESGKQASLPTLSEETVSPEEEPDDLQGFTFQHFIANQALDKVEIPLDPMMLLNKFKQSLQSLLSQHQSDLKVKTEVQLRLSQQAAAQLSVPLPTLYIDSQLSSQGDGSSKLTLSPLKIDNLPGGNVDWQGLTGELTFTERMDTVMADLQIAQVTFKESKGFTSTLAPSLLKMTFDADLIPVQGKFASPSILLKESQGSFDLKNLSAEFETVQHSSGVELNQGEFKLGQLQAYDTESLEKVQLENLTLQGHGNVEKDLFSYVIRNQIGRFQTQGTDAKDNLDLKSSGQIKLQNLDTKAVASFQVTLRELQKQAQQGLINEQMLGLAILGKLMEVTPLLLTRSPTLSFSELQMTSPEGGLVGELTLGIEGAKVTQLNDFNLLFNATWGKSEFKISKPLLKKLLVVSLSKERSQADRQLEADKRIESYLQEKWLVETKDSYVLSANLNSGKLYINGKLFPLPFGKSEKLTKEE